MHNNATLVGRLTKDPEVRKTQNGKSVVNFTVACDRGFGDKKTTDFIGCQAWDKIADFMGNYLKQGALVLVEGFNLNNSYKKEDGSWVNSQVVNATRVQSLESRQQREDNAASHSYSYDAPAFSQPASVSQPDPEDEQPALDISNDDLPF